MKQPPKSSRFPRMARRLTFLAAAVWAFLGSPGDSLLLDERGGHGGLRWWSLEGRGSWSVGPGGGVGAVGEAMGRQVAELGGRLVGRCLAFQPLADLQKAGLVGGQVRVGGCVSWGAAGRAFHELSVEE